MGFFKKKRKIHVNEDVGACCVNTLSSDFGGDGKISLQKGDEIVQLDEKHFLKRYRDISDALRTALDEATLVFVASDAYMHYMQDNLEEDMDDQQYLNQAVFFWEATEAFPRKSLPPHWEDFPRKYFRIVGSSDDIGTVFGEVAPWFGQPGGGTKYYFARSEEDMVTLAQAESSGLIEYFHFVDLTEDNAGILTDREQYYFLTNGRSLDFIEGWPAIGGQQIPISVAYECGLFDIVCRTSGGCQPV
jgi:hypothetical protein